MTNKKLGLYTLSGLVVANMVGAGVFTTSGFAIGDLGSPAWVMLAWLVGGGIAICGALSYGNLARLMPESGGEYLFLSRNIHPLLGFIAGWISLLAGFTGAIAYAAMTFEAYILTAEVRATLPENLIATGVIIFAALIHGIRLGVGTLIQNVIVILKILLICVFIIFALLYIGDSQSSQASSVATTGFSIYTFAVTVMWISFSYSGFNAAVYIAGEVSDARYNVPRSMILGTVLVTGIYLALNAVFVYIPSVADIAYQQDIAVIVAQELAGNTFSNFVRFVIALALFTSVSAMIMIGPRVYAKMADDGFMPRSLKLSGETPRNAIALQAILAVAVVWLSTLRELLSYLGFTLSLCLALTIFSLFVIKSKATESVSLPGHPWAAVIFIAATLIIAALAAKNEPIQMLASLVTFISGAIVYFFLNRKGKSEVDI